MIPLLKVNRVPAVSQKIAEVFESGFIADGDYVKSFEKGLGEFIGNPRVVTVNNEASAITLALYLAGVRPGDEIIASPLACTASTMPILNLFAKPVWADVDPQTGMMDPSKIEPLIGKRVKAILYTYWGGGVGDIHSTLCTAAHHDLKVVEDATESFGAMLDGKFVGNLGADFTVFSFGPVRHITTIDGGAIFFKEEGRQLEAQKLKKYGIDRTTFRDEWGELNPESDIPKAGYNFYLNNVGAAVGLEQMKGLREHLKKYYENGAFYREALSKLPGLTMLKRPLESQSSFWVFTLLAERSRELIRRLKTRGIEASKLHLRNDTYSCYGTGIDETLSGVREFYDNVVCLPSGWWVTEEERNRIVQALKEGW